MDNSCPIESYPLRTRRDRVEAAPIKQLVRIRVKRSEIEKAETQLANHSLSGTRVEQWIFRNYSFVRNSIVHCSTLFPERE